MNHMANEPAQSAGDQPSPLRNPSAPDPGNETRALAQYARVLGVVSIVVGCIGEVLLGSGAVRYALLEYLAPVMIVVGLVLNVLAFVLRRR